MAGCPRNQVSLMTDKQYETLQDEVIRSLENTEISKYHRGEGNFTLGKDGWQIHIQGPKGFDSRISKFYANSLTMMVLEPEKTGDSNLSAGERYSFSGEKVSALYVSLSEKWEARKEEQRERAKKKIEEQQASQSGLSLLEAFVKK